MAMADDAAETVRRALIVDDDPLARTLIAASFAEIGFEVSTAGDGLEALSLAGAQTFSCVVLDVQMPGPSGFEVCRELRRMPQYRTIPILIQTGLDDHRSIEQAFEAGASDYLTKPVNDALLRHRIRFVMKAAELVGELEDKRAKLDEALNLAHLGHWEYLYDSGAMISSEAALRVFRVARELPRDEYFRRIHPDDQQRVRHELARLGKEAERVEFTHRWLSPDGEQLVIHLNAMQRRDHTGRVVAAVGSAQDVTEREAILETMRLWSQVIETTAEGMLLVNRDLRPLQVNAAFSQITGLALEGLRRDGWRFFDDVFRRQIQPALERVGRWQGERTSHGADGQLNYHWFNVGVLLDDTGRPGHYVVMVSDVSALRRSQSRLDYLARHDSLTGLPNRAAMMEYLHEQIIAIDPREGAMALLYLDLDRFKNVNDSLGQHWGDRVLLAVSDRLRGHLPPTAVLGRPESDEFMVMMTDLRSPADAVALAEALLEALRPALKVEHYEFAIGASVGIAFHPQHAGSVEELVKNANIAMHRAKARGRNRLQVFSEQMSTEIVDRLALEAQIRAALARGEFQLHYQPKVELATGRVVGAEALVRWPHPSQGSIAPGRFVPVAEESGLIAELGRWVMSEAAAQAARWHAEGLRMGHIAVNVAGPQVWRGDFLDHIQGLLRRYDLEPSLLQVEITETLLMSDATQEDTVRRLEALRDLGLKLAIDDFGTGYSSLSRLKRLPVATLKIDQSFVNGVCGDANDAAIVRAIIAMARTLGLATVAEGVETEEQLSWLRHEGCDMGQGYLFGKALPAAAFVALVNAGTVGTAGPRG